MPPPPSEIFENTIWEGVPTPSEITQTKGNIQNSRVKHPVYYVEEIKGIVLVFN